MVGEHSPLQETSSLTYLRFWALRSRPTDVIDKFDAAFRENADLATKMAFYGRDVRGGLGERAVGRLMLRELALLYPEVVVANFKNIVKFGRYDDLFVFFDTSVETDMIEFIKKGACA